MSDIYFSNLEFFMKPLSGRVQVPECDTAEACELKQQFLEMPLEQYNLLTRLEIEHSHRQRLRERLSKSVEEESRWWVLKECIKYIYGYCKAK